MGSKSDAARPWALGGGCGRACNAPGPEVRREPGHSEGMGVMGDFEGWLGAWAEARLVLGVPGAGAGGAGGQIWEPWGKGRLG